MPYIEFMSLAHGSRQGPRYMVCVSRTSCVAAQRYLSITRWRSCFPSLSQQSVADGVQAGRA
eukprot:15455191-Alexandrium_andersonii.AAC.1